MLRMIRLGLLAGLGLLLAVAVLEAAAGRRTAPAASRTGQGGADTDADEQVWQVLAEARRIVEESA